MQNLSFESDWGLLNGTQITLVAAKKADLLKAVIGKSDFKQKPLSK